MEITNINPILDLLKSENREDFELGVNMLESIPLKLHCGIGDVPLFDTLLEDETFEYKYIKGRLKRRYKHIGYCPATGSWRWSLPYSDNWEKD